MSGFFSVGKRYLDQMTPSVRRRLSVLSISSLAMAAVTVLFTVTVPAAEYRDRHRTAWENTGRWAESQLARMTLEQKVSHLFSAAARGVFRSSDDPEYRRLVDLVENFGVGGIIFFQGDPYSQAVLANDLQERARLPLLVSQDMEWGAGMRIERTTTFPQTMAIGATRNTDYAYALGYVTAREARAVGAHQIFAPVADINNNPYNPIINVRSFSEDPQLVADMVAAVIRGAQDGGVLATVKHFPGHGDTEVDSHAALPVLPIDRQRLDTLELIPFRRAIEEGVLSVMTGHLEFPLLESEANLPASLSHNVTTGLLREELGFDGLIVTDALNMQGVTDHYGPGEAAVRAVKAGADMLLMSTDEYAARAAIMEAIAAGEITVAQIDASVTRILRAKEWAGLNRERTVSLSATREAVATRSNQAISEAIARESLTLLRNRNDLLPLPTTGNRILSVALSDAESTTAGRYFASELREHVPGDQLTTRVLDRRSNAQDYDAALSLAARHDIILVPTYLYVRSWSGRIDLPDEHKAFLNRLVATGKPVVLISFGNPYMIMGIDSPDVYLAAYGASEASQRAVAQALFGKSSIRGRLPITIPGYHEFGEGLKTVQVAQRTGLPEEVGMNGRFLARADSLIQASISARAFPGAAIAIGRSNVVARLQGYGYHTYTSERRVTPRTVFDVASLTKVVATTAAVMKLYDEGRLNLDAPVIHYVPAFGQGGKEQVTVRHLLTHTSGLPSFRPFHREGFTGRQQIIEAIMAESPEFRPGSATRYSDLGYITLGLVVEAITGHDLATYTREQVFLPLGMRQTGFRSVGTIDEAIVPTEYDRTFRHRLMQGEVHDEAAYLMGGTAGHAGLFSTAEDLARFAQMLLGEGTLGGFRFVAPETVRLFTARSDFGSGLRALGWDLKAPTGYSSAGSQFGARSFGHTGFTGTSIWVDPDASIYVILLTNRVYPTRENQRLVAVRPQLADIAFEAIISPPRPLLPGPR
jgi:beta-N-acetylhexosaminidase